MTAQQNQAPRMILLAACFAVILGAAAQGQVLFVDEFDDTSGPSAAQGDGIVDVSAWRPAWGGVGDYVGRTQFRFDLPAENVAAGVAGSTDGKVAVLELDTYYADDPGNSFLGTDLVSKRNFALGGGLRMTTRMRLDGAAAAQRGMVGAAFLYDVTRTDGGGADVRDEIDHELLTNEVTAGTPHRTLTNVWDDGPFSGPGSGGSPQMINNTGGFDISQFHDYRTDWYPNRVEYYIDGSLVRTETSAVPDDPMRAHVNFWAPGSDFADAYEASFLPTATSPGTTYKLELDRMEIERLNTSVSSNMLTDGGFENLALGDVNDSTSGTGTGKWYKFSNASLDGAEMEPQEGFQSLKMFGPFTGGPNATGVWQNVAASPGEEFEGSVFCQAPNWDPILGTENFTEVQLKFVDSAGAVINEVNWVGENQQVTAMLDGRDVNMIEDEWVEYRVNAIAPAGTAYVRMQLNFVQLNNEGGAAWFDNASLVRLTNTTPPIDPDFDGDGDVDVADLMVWQRTDGTADALAAWKAEFTGAPASAVTAIPEPGALALGFLAIGGLLAGRRRR